MGKENTKEPQYQIVLDVREKRGITRFGLMSNQVWLEDPKRLGFLLARYKFVAKMFDGFDSVLEVGCADAFGTRVVRQAVHNLTAIDFDPVFIADVLERMDQDENWRFDAYVHDMLQGPVNGKFDGIYAMDVFEHILPKDEEKFINNLCRSISEDGVVILGIPSLESQTYASSYSKEGHVNCKTAKELKAFLKLFFHNVFIFSMNDEVVHTGFYPMANYLIALCCNKSV